MTLTRSTLTPTHERHPMHTLTTTAAALLAGGLALAPGAAAATGYMNGALGTSPGYSTITGPNGERCSTGCAKIPGYDGFTVQSAEAGLIKWLEAHPDEQNTIWTYSATSQAVINVANDRPDLFANTTVIALAPPKQGSIGYEQVTAPNPVRMTQAIVKGDSVADPAGSSFSTHLNGYRNLDLRNPSSSTPIEGTGTVRNFYDRPVSTAPRFNLFRPSTWIPKTTAQPAATTAKVEQPSRREIRAQKRAERRERAAEARAERRAARAARSTSTEKAGDSE